MKFSCKQTLPMASYPDKATASYPCPGLLISPDETSLKSSAASRRLHVNLKWSCIFFSCLSLQLNSEMKSSCRPLHSLFYLCFHF